MIHDGSALARQAIAAAIRVRQKAQIGPTAPLCIFDFVEQQGIEVRFKKADSMEGLYVKMPGPVILLGSARPSGRQAFTCAHEYGHHCFSHGTRLDEIDATDTSNDPDEFVADCFAGYLLMPKLAIVKAFTERGWDAHAPTELQAYCIACLFGVGYASLLHHMWAGLGLITQAKSASLSKKTLKSIRRSLLGFDGSAHLVVVDTSWRDRPIDVHVGDHVLLPEGAICDGQSLEQDSLINNHSVFIASRPGIGRIVAGSWAAFIRTSRSEYVGLSAYRHLEEA